MALSRALILLVALTATIFSTLTMAAEFIVGDDKGWTTHVDYQAWARNKVFHVGDIIEFNYPAGKDSVVIVNTSNFIECRVPPNAPVYSSGLDAFEFVIPGPRFFISGVVDHCKMGQKLSFYVFPQVVASPPIHVSPPPPAPAPSSEAANDSPLLPPVVLGPIIPPFVPAPWSHDAAPAPAPVPSSCDTWTTGFFNFARSVPRKLFRVFHEN